MSVLSALFVLSILSVLSVRYIRNWDIKGYMYGDGGYDMIEVLWQLKTSIYIFWERILVHLRGLDGVGVWAKCTYGTKNPDVLYRPLDLLIICVFFFGRFCLTFTEEEEGKTWHLHVTWVP